MLHRLIATTLAAIEAHGKQEEERAVARKGPRKAHSLAIKEDTSGHKLSKVAVPNVGTIYQCQLCRTSVGASRVRRWLDTTTCTGMQHIIVGPSGWARPTGPVSIGDKPAHASHRLQTRGIYTWCAACGSYNRIANNRTKRGMP